MNYRGSSVNYFNLKPRVLINFFLSFRSFVKTENQHCIATEKGEGGEKNREGCTKIARSALGKLLDK